jgi:hypothetical protein
MAAVCMYTTQTQHVHKGLSNKEAIYEGIETKE